MTDYNEDDAYGTDVEDDDEDEDIEVDSDVEYPEVGATYVVECFTCKAEVKANDRYPEGQQIINAVFIIKEDEDFEGTRLFSNWYMGTSEDPNNIAREDLNQCFYALTGERAGKGTPVKPKAMRGKTCTVQIASGEYKDKESGETKGSGVRPKLKSWKQYDGE